ncbi:MAG: hypothetical protein ACR2GW_05205 [Pyrinomonadaceae bacterium]|nr:hypothetical protein [Pyrinomonadaceae bacterium]MDQ3584386.1 hypothetical protein [Acidobacteriota bacterium]
MKFLALCAALLATGAVAEAQDRPTEATAVLETQISTTKVEGELSPSVQEPLVVIQLPATDYPKAGAAPPHGHDLTVRLENPSSPNLQPTPRDEAGLLAPPPDAAKAEELRDEDDESHQPDSRFHWLPAIKQSLLFLAVQHSYALTQPKTQRDLHGPFFKDYARSVKSLHGWGDGGRFFTNYIAHPIEGSLTGFIQIQNDPRGVRQRFGASPAYWRSRLKAFAWSAAWSTQFEIGPISQASIGNVGLHGKQTYVDLVVTPTVGLGLLVAEDAVDKYVVAKIERNTDSRYLRIASRMILNPTRSIANLLRFKKPWYRDAGLR